MGTIITFVLIGIVIQFASRFILKIVGWLLIAGGVVFGLYYFGIGPFEKNPISIKTWEKKYCEQPGEEIKCNCIVTPVKNDLEKRFTAEELKEMQKNRTEWLYVVKKSFEEVSSEIDECLEKNNAEHELKEFRKDLIPLDNGILEGVEDFIDDLSDEAEEQFEDWKDKKEDIDRKYD